MFDPEKNELLEFDSHEDFGVSEVQDKILEFKEQNGCGDKTKQKVGTNRRGGGRLIFKKQVMNQVRSINKPRKQKSSLSIDKLQDQHTNSYDMQKPTSIPSQ